MPEQRAEAAAHYRAVLDQLHKMRTDAEEGIRVIERLLEAQGEAVPVVPQARVGGESLASQALRLLATEPQAAFTLNEIRARLGGPNYGTLRGVIAELARKGRVKRPTRGAYQAR